MKISRRIRDIIRQPFAVLSMMEPNPLHRESRILFVFMCCCVGACSSDILVHCQHVLTAGITHHHGFMPMNGEEDDLSLLSPDLVFTSKEKY